MGAFCSLRPVASVTQHNTSIHVYHRPTYMHLEASYRGSCTSLVKKVMKVPRRCTSPSKRPSFIISSLQSFANKPEASHQNSRSGTKAAARLAKAVRDEEYWPDPRFPRWPVRRGTSFLETTRQSSANWGCLGRWNDVLPKHTRNLWLVTTGMSASSWLSGVLKDSVCRDLSVNSRSC